MTSGNVVPFEQPRGDLFGRTRPANVDLEQEVLGAILMAPGSLGQVDATLKAEHFSELPHQAIYEAITAAAAAQQTPTPAFVVQHIGQRAASLEIGLGVTLRSYIDRLRIEGAALSGLTAHATVIRDLWALRRIEDIAQDIGKRDGYEPSAYVQECFDKLDDVRAQLASRRAHTATAEQAGQGLLARISRDLEGTASPIPSTGLPLLDREIGGGLQQAFLLTVPARTSMGKSIFGTEVGQSAAAQGFGTIYHSLEMHRDQVAARMAASRLERMGVHIAYERMIRRGGLDAAEARHVARALDFIARLPFVVEDGGGRTITEIGAASERLANAFARKGIPLGPVIIDHAHIVRPTRAYKREDEGFKEVADGALALAKRLETCVVLLAQCNRGPESREDKRPSLADVRGAGAFEEDSDAVMFLYRPAYYIERSPKFRSGDRDAADEHAATRHMLELIIDKNRAGRSNQVLHAWVDVSLNAIRAESPHAYAEMRQ